MAFPRRAGARKSFGAQPTSTPQNVFRAQIRLDIFSCSNAPAQIPLQISSFGASKCRIHAFVQNARDLDHTRRRHAIEEDVYGRRDWRLAAFFAGVANGKAAKARGEAAAFDSQ
jgi:hypothetical protein